MNKKQHTRLNDYKNRLSVAMTDQLVAMQDEINKLGKVSSDTIEMRNRLRVIADLAQAAAVLSGRIVDAHRIHAGLTGDADE